MTPEDVLNCWFYEIGQDRWFGEDRALDSSLRDRFLIAYEQALTGAYNDWQQTPEGMLALLLLVGEMPRRMFRGSARAFEIAGAFLRPRARRHHPPFRRPHRQAVQAVFLSAVSQFGKYGRPASRPLLHPRAHQGKRVAHARRAAFRYRAALRPFPRAQSRCSAASRRPRKRPSSAKGPPAAPKRVFPARAISPRL